MDPRINVYKLRIASIKGFSKNLNEMRDEMAIDAS